MPRRPRSLLTALRNRRDHLVSESPYDVSGFDPVQNVPADAVDQGELGELLNPQCRRAVEKPPTRSVEFAADVEDAARLRAPPVKPLDHGCVTGCRGMATRVAVSAGSGRAGTAGMSAWRHRGNNARLVTGWWCAMPERAGGAEGARVTE